MTKRSLRCRKNSIPVPLHFPQVFLFPQFLAQPLLSTGKLLPGLLQLGLTGSDGSLQRLSLLQPSLDQLILKFSGFIPLGFQLLLMLEGELLLFG